MIGCEGLESTQEQYAFTVFERLFKEYGLPDRIRSDNGVRFASAHALYGLSRLAVWWLRLDIEIERLKPGNAQQNGRHERPHQALENGGHERPHQALDMKRPGDLYLPSARSYVGLPEVEYPFHDHTVTVSACGRICFGSKKINPSQVFAGQKVSVKEEGDGIWQVSFMRYEIGYFDLDTCRVEPVNNPFGPKVLTMFPV